ncbi:MAG: hypothetical protein QNJ94_02900 [Alphaproteobacteria bacterium]|nr:hypothetical protein [Alphaproteobacteria bacterium]
MDALWDWFGEPKNREMLAWIGGALAVVVSGWWTAFTYFRKAGGSDDRSDSDRGGD